MCPTAPTPLHEQPESQGFGRVSVGFQGRVMHYIAQGPFDLALMAAAKRAAISAAGRMPPDRRYVSLMEFRQPLLLDDEGRREFIETVSAFITRQIVPLETILLVAPGDERAPMVLDLAEVYRQSRPLKICTDAAAAWREANAVLRRAGLPEEPAPGFTPD